jgi:two-component system response regulator PilR (NtrC family)
VLALPDKLQDYLDAQERDFLCRVLRDTCHNRTAAASKTGICWGSCVRPARLGHKRTAAASKPGISLHQIRYRIARLKIAMPEGDAQDTNHVSTDGRA